MPVATASNAEAVLLSILHEVLQSKDSGWNEGEFRLILNRQPPVVERLIGMHLHDLGLSLVLIDLGRMLPSEDGFQGLEVVDSGGAGKDFKPRLRDL